MTASGTASRTGSRPLLTRDALVAGGVLVNTELLALLAYFVLSDAVPYRPLVYVYPFVWLNVALWGVWRVRQARRVSAAGASTRRRAVAGALGVGYLLALGSVGGLYAVGAGGPDVGPRLVVAGLPPGWSPALLYTGGGLTLALVSFRVVGYAALAYLLAVALVDTRGPAALGPCLVGALPLLAGTLGGFVGDGAALVGDGSYALSTLVFVLAVALLVRRPTAADLARLGGWVR
ncbi:DUF7546 family protein [Halomarina ordinaria]|uniref:ABC transporter ATP-binding protein n=1 Tax=Halomarina ordinaria TaxID=3033939 RepID=A0ABD5UAH9_9EURY|nr:ABC transporter ATP-binding protein [Halomarina sp. PSRA2]